MIALAKRHVREREKNGSKTLNPCHLFSRMTMYTLNSRQATPPSSSYRSGIIVECKPYQYGQHPKPWSVHQKKLPLALRRLRPHNKAGNFEKRQSSC